MTPASRSKAGRSVDASLLALASPFLIVLLGASAAAAAEDDLWGGGRFDLRYVFRANDHGKQDQDLTQDLFVEGGRGSAVRFEASGRVREDIDGQGQRSPFRDIYDSYDRPATAWLYTGYGEILDQGVLARARLGRQYYAEGVEVRFDGGLVETRPLGDAVAFTAYGGVPVNLYESSTSGDWLAGAAAELIAIPRTNVRLDYVHLTDERHDEFVDATRDDDYFQLAITHRLTRELRLHGTASTFEGRSSRFTAETFYREPDWDLSSHARFTAQLGAYRDLSIQFTPLDDLLDTYEPYFEGFVEVRKGIGDHVSLGGGFARRELAHESKEGEFNHEFSRYFLLADVLEWPWEGFLVSLVGDWYTSDVGDRTFQGSFDITQKIGDITAGLGTSYALYKFDEVFMTERNHVRTWFASFEWRVRSWVTWRLSYSYEDDDEDNYHVARCDLRFHF